MSTNGEDRTRRRTPFFESEPGPRPRSEVFVPAKDTTAGTHYVTLLDAMAQILASTVAIIAIATEL